MKILIFDNYDSFTYNIVHAVRELGYEPDIIRNNKLTTADVEKYDKIIISPGPGLPCESGILPELLKKYAPTKSILGVCLGEQAIGECFGATLRNMDTVMHGIQTPIKQVSEDYIFEGVQETFPAGRYHSWVVDKKNFPDELTITAEDEKGEIMGLRHKKYDVHGIQFHPESILTPDGIKILDNFLKH